MGLDPIKGSARDDSFLETLHMKRLDKRGNQ